MRALRLFLVGMVALLLWGCGGSSDGPVPAPAREDSDADADGPSGSTLWLTFDTTDLAYDGQRVYADDEGRPFVGRVRTARGGTVELRPGPEGRGDAVAFPRRCRATVCPRAMIEVENTQGLNPGSADFSYGASILMRPNDTSTGSNILQKGRFETDGGLWKLQVDTLEGKPSCVLRYGDQVLNVRSHMTVADSEWHTVVCNRTGRDLEIVVDGVSHSERGRIRTVGNGALVRIGSAGLHSTDDQFHGAVDDVFLRIDGPTSP